MAVQEMKDQAKSLAHDAKEEVSHVAGQARDQVQGLVTRQKDRVADQLGSLAGALRDTGSQLGQKVGGQQSNLLDLGGYAGKAAEQVDRFSSYLRDRELVEVVRDAETFARRRPELFLGGTFLAGLLLARFLKASGEAENLAAGNQSYPIARNESLVRPTGSSYQAAPRTYTAPVGG